MKQKIVSILTSPLFITFVISVFVVYFQNDYFPKYKVTPLETFTTDRENQTYFEDLDSDHKSEKITYRENVRGNVSFDIKDSNGGLLDQWNYEGSHASQFWELWFFDIDKNGFKEIYVLTKRNDSIYLNIEEPFVKNGISKKGIFLEYLHETDEKFFLSSYIFANTKTDSIVSNQLFINLNRGFSGNPRNLYRYHPESEKFIKSVHLTNQSRINAFFDLDLDGNKEILLQNYSSGNSIDSKITKRSDYSSWFMVLDENLKFKFEPIEIKNPFSSIESMPLKNKSGDYDILNSIVSNRPNDFPNKLQLYSHEGSLLKEQNVTDGGFFIFPGKNETHFYLYHRTDGVMSHFNNELIPENSFAVVANSLIYPFDIENDGVKEWLTIETDQKTVTIFDENFESPVRFKVPSTSNKPLYPRLKEIAVNQNELYFTEGNNYYVYQYKRNPLYYYKYLLYLLTFMVILGIVWFIRKGQQLKIEKQRAIENEIAQLQIKSINNQIDPHFVFNAINTISEMTLLDNKLEADDFICKFSDFMRGTLKNSDKITSSLEEEINFTENFIKLQRIRFNKRFDYVINVEENVDLAMIVPKHVLFSYVENAIKHGLSKTKDKGMLKINVSVEDSKLLLVIEDNGPEIQISETSKKNSTGNGLRIMEEMFELYYNLYKKRIHSKLIELIDQNKNKIGLKVELRIST